MLFSTQKRVLRICLKSIRPEKMVALSLMADCIETKSVNTLRLDNL